MRRNWKRIAEILAEIEEETFSAKIDFNEITTLLDDCFTHDIEEEYEEEVGEYIVECDTAEDTFIVSLLLDARYLQLYNNSLQMTWKGFELLDSLRSISTYSLKTKNKD